MSTKAVPIILPLESDLAGIKRGALYYLDKKILDSGVGDYKSDIMKATTPSEVISIFTRPCMLGVIDSFYELMSIEDLSEALAEAWTCAESPNMDSNMSKAKAVKLFSICNPEKLMSFDELTVFQQLPDEITVYRGLGKRNSKNLKALSWTLDYKVAEWFAKRFDFGAGEYEVYKANIKKKDVFALFNSRREQEIILNYRKLFNIESVLTKKPSEF